MSNKKTISIISIWIASFLFGVFYNINLLRLPYTNLWFNFSRTTLLYVLVGILCASLTYLLKDFIKTKLKMKKTMYFMWIAVIGTALCYLRFNNIREDLINGAFILLIYPLSLMTIYNAPKYTHKYLVMASSILATGALAYITSGIKFMLFTFLLEMIAEIIVVVFFNATDWKKWLIHFFAMSFIFILLFCIVGTTSPNLLQRIIGFLNPKEVYEYNNLIKVISNFEWVTYYPENTFTEDINSLYACTYSHILVSLGLIPLLIIALIQAIGIALMGKQSWSFKCSKRRYMGLMCTAIMGLHLILGVSSSFLRIPMAEFGGPFLTSVGMEYSIFPAAFYLYLEWLERNKSQENEEKIESIYDKIIHSNSKFIKFFHELIGIDC